MRMHLIYVIIAAFIAQITFAHACDCMRPSSIEDQIDGADLIFVGKATKTVLAPYENTTDFPIYETTFTVVEVLKGETEQRVAILHNKSVVGVSNCGVTFKAWDQFEIFARLNSDGRFEPSECVLAPGYRDFKGWAWEDYRKSAGRQ